MQTANRSIGGEEQQTVLRQREVIQNIGFESVVIRFSNLKEAESSGIKRSVVS